ncbi:MAG TPA: aldehyde dehydrogenase family protein [Anaerolineaceae bacterium]|nr:aldehyde dehydrogenase family protein [Anaerolineaceae bacterium]HPN54103.1 aldehyde dehydrogenase family protein [Anaerolineaceae bacterium]
MPDFDADLLSIQEARHAVLAAHAAQQQWQKASQEEVDRVCAALARAGEEAAERLGRMAHEETGYGVPQHKTLKNLFCSKMLWDAIRDEKTVGVIRRDEARKVVEIAWPMGVIAALVPSTNPTSTTLFKTIIALKARNGIVIAPHPAAARCTAETARLLAAAAEEAGAPKGLIGCLTHISLAGTSELMSHYRTALILATGGSAMVKAAHSVGKPAYGVGPGNVPCYVDRSADLNLAARYLVASKAFDHSVICATEQAAIVDRPVAAEFARLVEAEGGYFVSPQQADLLRRALFSSEGAINPRSVGKSPQALAEMAGFQVPPTVRILIARLEKIGREEPLSREKLTTVLGWYEVDGWQAGCERCIEMIRFGGDGHSCAIHARDESIIMAFGLEKPVHRIVVNTMSSLGGVGFTTGIAPSMTLGPGGVGGAITGDNITVHHLYTVKRLAYEVTPPPAAALQGSSPAPMPAPAAETKVDEIVRRVLQQLGRS